MSYEHVERLSESQILDLHRLYRGEWWSQDRTIEDTRRVLEHSSRVFGVVLRDSGRLVAFARVLTDRIFKALVFDVIVDPEHRGSGVGKRLMERILDHPELRAVRHLELYCLPDLEPFYESLGFTASVGGVRLMRRTFDASVERR